MSSKIKTILIIVFLALVLMVAVWFFFDWRIRSLKDHPEQPTSIGRLMWMQVEWVKL